MSDRRFWNEPVEALAPDELRRLEGVRLKEELAWVASRSPFYEKKLADAGIDPALVGRDDLGRIPFTTKAEVRATQEEHPPLGGHACVPMHEVNRIHASSGTTGRPVIVGATRADIAMWNEMVARTLWAQGVRAGTRAWVAAMMSWWIAGLSFYGALEQMGATVLPGGNVEPARSFAVVAQTGCDYVISTPSFAWYLAGFARDELGIDPRSLGVKTMGVGGEPGGGIPEIRARLEEAWGCKVYDGMGAADFCTNIWSECEAQDGMHFFGQGLLIAELINGATGETIDLEAGAEGELVYTAIKRECVPLIRYRIGDVVRVEGTGACACGREGPRIRCIGRADDMFIVQGVNVYPAAVVEVVSSFRPRTTGEIEIRVASESHRVEPPVLIRVEAAGAGGVGAAGSVDLAREIESAIRSRLMFRAAVEFVGEGSLAATGGMKRSVLVRQT